jgi:hypothetical protein
MYAMIRSYEGVTDASEAARLVSKNFVPLISKIPGLVAYYVIDAGEGEFVSVSIFKDKLKAEESNQRAAGWVQDNVAALLPNPPQIKAGEVVATKRGALMTSTGSPYT